MKLFVVVLQKHPGINCLDVSISLGSLTTTKKKPRSNPLMEFAWYKKSPYNSICFCTLVFRAFTTCKEVKNFFEKSQNSCHHFGFSIVIYNRGTGKRICFHSCTHTLIWRLALSFRCGLKRDGAQLSCRVCAPVIFRENVCSKRCMAVPTHAKK